MPFVLPQLFAGLPVCPTQVMHVHAMKCDNSMGDATFELQSRSHVISAASLKRLLMLIQM